MTLRTTYTSVQFAVWWTYSVRVFPRNLGGLFSGGRDLSFIYYPEQLITDLSRETSPYKRRKSVHLHMSYLHLNNPPINVKPHHPPDPILP